MSDSPVTLYGRGGTSTGGGGGGAPSGPAGGVLGGTYPNPTFAVDMATQAELDAAIATAVILAPAASARNVIQPSADVINLPLRQFSGQTADVLQVQSTSGATVFATLSASGQYRLYTTSGGANPTLALDRAAGGAGLAGLLIGAGGASATDTKLYRASAGVLKTDGQFTALGDITADATGSSTTTPRKFGFTNLGAGTATRFFFGDDFNAFQLKNGGRTTIYGYFGVEIMGARVDAVTAPSFSSGTVNDAALTVIAPSGGAGSARRGLVVLLPGSPEGNAFEVQNSGGTALALIDTTGKLRIGAGTPTQNIDAGLGLYGGGTNSATAALRSTLDLAANSGFSAAQFAFNAGGKFMAGEVSVLGTNDVFFQALPATTSGYGYLETWAGAGMVLGTGNATPVLIRPNRTTVATFSSAGQLALATQGSAAGLTIGGDTQIYRSASAVLSVATSVALQIRDSLQIGTSNSFGGGTNVLGVANASVVPSTNPTAGGVLYSESATLKWRDTGGLITNLMKDRDELLRAGLGYTGETGPKSAIGSSALALVSGDMYGVAAGFFKGDIVTNVLFYAGAAIQTITTFKVGLWDSAGNLLASSANSTTNMSAGITSFALSSPFTITADGLYYLGWVVVATTPGSVSQLGAGVTGKNNNIGSGSKGMLKLTGQTDIGSLVGGASSASTPWVGWS